MSKDLFILNAKNLTIRLIEPLLLDLRFNEKVKQELREIINISNQIESKEDIPERLELIKSKIDEIFELDNDLKNKLVVLEPIVESFEVCLQDFE